MKTIQSEDQYAITFGLELWTQEPREIIFFKKGWIALKVFVRKHQTGDEKMIVWSWLALDDIKAARRKMT